MSKSDTLTFPQLASTKGLVHLAGSLQDQLLSNLRREHFQATYGPKVWGLQHLRQVPTLQLFIWKSCDFFSDPQIVAFKLRFWDNWSLFKQVFGGSGPIFLQEGDAFQGEGFQRWTATVFVVDLQALERCNQWESLDFLVTFSSTAGIFGAAGQGNYAAANACMDAWMYKYRRGARCKSQLSQASKKNCQSQNAFLAPCMVYLTTFAVPIRLPKCREL